MCDLGRADFQEYLQTARHDNIVTMPVVEDQSHLLTQLRSLGEWIHHAGMNEPDLLGVVAYLNDLASRVRQGAECEDFKGSIPGQSFFLDRAASSSLGAVTKAGVVVVNTWVRGSNFNVQVMQGQYSMDDIDAALELDKSFLEHGKFRRGDNKTIARTGVMTTVLGNLLAGHRADGQTRPLNIKSIDTVPVVLTQEDVQDDSSGILVHKDFDLLAGMLKDITIYRQLSDPEQRLVVLSGAKNVDLLHAWVRANDNIGLRYLTNEDVAAICPGMTARHLEFSSAGGAEGFGVAILSVDGGCDESHKLIVMCPSLGWASSVFCPQRGDYLGCFVAVANFVRFALFAMEPLPNDDLVRFMFAGVKGGCSNDLCASAAASFAARSDPLFVSPCVALGKLPNSQAQKDAASKTGKLPATQAQKDATTLTMKGVKKVYKCGGASWKKRKSGCGAIHPSGAGLPVLNGRTVQKLPCPADDPSCPKYVNPSKKQKSVASFFGKKT